MTLVGHLEELRRRLGISLLAFIIAAGASFVYAERLVQWLLRPAQPLLPRLAFLTPTEPLSAFLQAAGLSGAVMAMPVMLVQLWGFVRVGLSPTERTLGAKFLGFALALFAAGIVFAYTVLLPVSLRVLLGVGQGWLEPMISIQRYVSFVSAVMLWSGVIFELPAVLWLLSQVGVVTAEWLRQQRPYAILMLVILAAIVTPTTDVVNLALMTLPLMALYELSILLARAVRRPTSPP